MKPIVRSRILATLFTVVLLPLLSAVCRADDLADAKTLFDTFLQYQKTDDPKALDMFMKDCVVKFTVTDGTHEQSQVIPTKDFLQQISDSIAKKEGDKDKYDNITYKQDGALVRMQCTITYAELGGKQAPFGLAFARDTDGKLKIKEFNATIPIPAQAAAPTVSSAPAPVDSGSAAAPK